MESYPIQNSERNYLKLACLSFFVISIILLLDQGSKFWVHEHISQMDHSIYRYPYGGIGIFQNFLGIDFSINYMTNKGAAWGFFSNYQLFLVVLRFFLICGTLVYIFFYNRHPSWRIPLLLIVGGAIGNVIDFFTYGHVIDMLHFVFWGYDFPVFNVADSAICIGIAALFILSWIEKEE